MLASIMLAPSSCAEGATDETKLSALQVAWLTPCEIFTAHYGRAVAHFLLQQHEACRKTAPLRIWELGAGTGTLARDILNHYRQVETTILTQPG